MSEIKLPKETMLEILDSGRVLEDTITGNSRWSTRHRIIFEHEGNLYSSHYSVGATEYQDESPWEWEHEVECTEVVKVEKTVTAYEPLEATP